MIIRERYLKQIRPFYNQELIKVLIGIRRSGKSVILTQIIDELTKQAIDEEHIIYMNFEDFDYEDYANPKKLHNYVKEKIKDDNIISLTNVSDKGRDKRMWVITTPNIVLFSPNDVKHMNVKAGDDAKEAEWFDLKLTADANFKPHNLYSYTKKDLQHLHLSIPDAMPLAFDHYDIIQSALRQLVLDFGRIQLPQIAKLLGDEVTTKDLINLFSQLVPNFKNVGATNLARHYHRDLIATRKVRKMPKGSAGGNSMRIYKVRKY